MQLYWSYNFEVENVAASGDDVPPQDLNKHIASKFGQVIANSEILKF